MRVVALLALLVVFACGCGGRGGSNSKATSPTGDTTGKAAQDKENFSGRLEAAKAIFDSNKRDAALAALALDAAKVREGEIAKQAVGGIFSSSAKDEAGYNAAVALARGGKGKEAKAVADLIFSTTRKDAAMAKIAEGG